MSHAPGYVLFKDGLKLFYEYNGTSDIVLPKLWKTQEEVTTHWRKGDPFDRKCTCGKDEEVIVYTSYGNGWNFSAKACRDCMVITNSPDPFENESEGEP